MIHDVDEALRKLVGDALKGAKVEVSFDAPTKDWASRRTQPTLSLYLYDIREDLDRRVVQYQDIRGDNGHVVDRRLPARMFKLSYLVTAWTQRPEDEHRLLSATMLCFLRSDALPPELFQGALAGQPGPIGVRVGQAPPKDRSIADVWTALGGELKPSFDVVVTAPFDTSQAIFVGPPVTDGPSITMRSEEGQVDSGVRKRRRSAAGAKG